jgi:hypothetical protein
MFQFRGIDQHEDSGGFQVDMFREVRQNEEGASVAELASGDLTAVEPRQEDELGGTSRLFKTSVPMFEYDEAIEGVVGDLMACFNSGA